jgi:colicin import membrane protein
MSNNVEMINAWLYNNAKNAEQRARNVAVSRSGAEAAEARAKLKAKKAQEAAKKAENQARQAAVERSAAEAAAARAARAAARGETSNRRNKTNTANKAAKKAAENAKKAQANAEKAEANAKKTKAEALFKNVQNKLVTLSQRQNINKSEMASQGRKIYMRAVKTMLFHPNKGANLELSQRFSSMYDDFKKFVNRN